MTEGLARVTELLEELLDGQRKTSAMLEEVLTSDDSEEYDENGGTYLDGTPIGCMP